MQEEQKLEQEVLELKKKIVSLKYLLNDAQRKAAFFEMLIKCSPGLFYLVDHEFRFYRWNENVERVAGYSSEDLLGRCSLDFFRGEDADRIGRSLRRAFDEGEAIDEADLVTKDGRRIPYLWTGVSAKIQGESYLVGMAIDLSERKRAERTLKESEEMYRTLTERMTIAVMLCHQDRIVSVNKALLKMFGYRDSNELLGKEVTLLVSQGYRGYLTEVIEAVGKVPSTEKSFQACGITKEGKDIWIEGWAKSVRWKDAPRILLTGRDITEHKQREISMREETQQLRRENINLRSSMKERYRLGRIIGRSHRMQEVYELILKAASADANVIIYGESGTGKELVAKAIHEMSRRATRAFVPVNCAAIPENLLENEFFGHEKGAFTGAYTDREGFLDMADGGTLFLDEIAELTPVLQAKLLRALEGSGYSAVGGRIIKNSDFRIIGATNEESLMKRVDHGLMRKDFFYRIHVLPIYLPPLRERKEDIPLLVEHFLKVYSKGESTPSLPADVMVAYLNYDWPGNVRELQNEVQFYLATNRSRHCEMHRDAEAIPEKQSPKGFEDLGDLHLQQSIEEAERAAIRRALDRYQGRKDLAAKALGISRMTLYRKLRRFGLL